MEWTLEPDSKNTALAHHALVLEPDDPLLPAFIALWTRIFADAAAAPVPQAQSFSVEIADRQTEDDTQGYLHAFFRNGLRRDAGLAQYFVRSDAFDLIQP